MNNLASLSVAQLQRAITIKQEIEALEAQLATLLGSAPTPQATPAPATPGKKVMSAAARARIAAAQKARWAAKKGVAKAPQAPVKAPSTKPKMSAEGRARIIAAQKARWAKVRAAQAQAKPQAPVAKPVQRVVRNISPAARKKMAEAAKARWAKIKAAKK